MYIDSPLTTQETCYTSSHFGVMGSSTFRYHHYSIHCGRQVLNTQIFSYYSTCNLHNAPYYWNSSTAAMTDHEVLQAHRSVNRDTMRQMLT